MTTSAYFQGTGRRKTSVSRVRLMAGEGEIVVNGWSPSRRTRRDCSRCGCRRRIIPELRIA